MIDAGVILHSWFEWLRESEWLLKTVVMVIVMLGPLAFRSFKS